MAESSNGPEAQPNPGIDWVIFREHHQRWWQRERRFRQVLRTVAAALAIDVRVLESAARLKRREQRESSSSSRQETNEPESIVEAKVLQHLAREHELGMRQGGRRCNDVVLYEVRHCVLVVLAISLN